MQLKMKQQLERLVSQIFMKDNSPFIRIHYYWNLIIIEILLN